ncbi:MAG: 50S ribosomal protein L10 [Patescibacteria group bacterium]|jgi:large subunit ribosomal protein L10
MKYKFRIALSPKQLREKSVEEIKKDLAGAKSLFLFSSVQVKHQDFEELRKKLATVNAKLKFVKNTLFRVAAKDKKLPENLLVDTVLFEQTAVVFINGEDFIAPIKMFKEAFGKNEAVKVKMAFLDKEVYEASRVLEFATIPSKQELYAKLVGSLKSPIYGLYYALTSDMRKLAYGLKAIADKQSN